MKQSKFNILVQPAEKPGFAILYNTFHDHRLVIENSELDIAELLRKVDEKIPLSAAEKDVADTFYEMGLFLDDDVDERRIFDSWYADKVQNPEGRLSLVVLTTMACNLRCPYCYELEQLDNSRHMTEETAEKFLHYVKAQVKTRPIEELEVIYFGGEPLMNKKVLYQLSGGLQKFCGDYGIKYQGAMVSNGVLMTPEVAKELRRVGLKWAKITLDGEKHVHDTTRITSSGRGSFDQIIYNLEHANDGLQEGEEPMQFILGGQFQEHTFEGFLPLIDRLATASFRPYIKQINLKPAQVPAEGSNGERSSKPCDKVCFSNENTERMIKLREELAKRGLPAIDGLNMGPCDFYRGDSLTIGIEGGIYPCIAFIENEACAVGNIRDEKQRASHMKVHQKWLETKPWTEDCYDCSFLPVCTGGCRATAYSNGYSWSSTVCEKEYFTRMSKALAKELLGVDAQSALPAAAPLSEGAAHLSTVADDGAANAVTVPENFTV